MDAPQFAEIQLALFEMAATKLAPHISLVDELAGMLEVSRDSAYRRLRGDTQLSLQETQLICRHFGLSLDALLGSDTARVCFQRDGVPDLGMEDRLAQVSTHLQRIDKAREKEITYFSMELPFFHLLQIPELLAFKQQFWESIAHPEKPLPSILLGQATESSLHQEIVNCYIRIPSTEIIYEAALGTTMAQILYFLESGCFVESNDALRLFGALKALVAHLKEQAILGRKFRYGAPAPALGPANTYRLFLNEMIYSQNIIHIRADGQEQVFLEHNVINFLRTDDPSFCAETRATLATIQSKSIPISAVSERERNKFFNRLEAGIERMRLRAEMVIAGA